MTDHLHIVSLNEIAITKFSTADTCKNCAKCGKGFKIGTNEAYNIKIKIRLLGAFRKFSALFSRQYGCLRQRYSTEEEILEKYFHLTSRIKCNHWKELTKFVQNDLGIILIG